jgi:hypothetical protein
VELFFSHQNQPFDKSEQLGACNPHHAPPTNFIISFSLNTRPVRLHKEMMNMEKICRDFGL